MFRNNSTAIHAAGRVVGEVHDGVFAKRVQASRHMLRSPKAWALDIDSLREAERKGAKSVEIHDAESGLTYLAAIAQIWAKGLKFNRGCGDQLALPLHLWRIEQPGARQLEMLPC